MLEDKTIEKAKSEPESVSQPAGSSLVQGFFYQGPLPHPVILKGFQEINPAYPDRVFALAEHMAKQEFELAKQSNMLADKQLDIKREELHILAEQRKKDFLHLLIVLVIMVAVLITLLLIGASDTANIFTGFCIAAVLVALIKKGARL
jgi:uncharacterized membrane protein